MLLSALMLCSRRVEILIALVVVVVVAAVVAVRFPLPHLPETAAVAVKTTTPTSTRHPLGLDMSPDPSVTLCMRKDQNLLPHLYVLM